MFSFKLNAINLNMLDMFHIRNGIIDSTEGPSLDKNTGVVRSCITRSSLGPVLVPITADGLCFFLLPFLAPTKTKPSAFAEIAGGKAAFLGTTTSDNAAETTPGDDAVTTPDDGAVMTPDDGAVTTPVGSAVTTPGVLPGAQMISLMVQNKICKEAQGPGVL